MYEMTFLFSKQICKMFLMLLVGFLAVKAKIIPGASYKGLTQVIVGIIRPCAILCAFQVSYTRERMLGLLLAFGGASLPIWC